MPVLFAKEMEGIDLPFSGGKPKLSEKLRQSY